MPPLYFTPCVGCGVNLWLPFRPARPKLCPRCCDPDQPRRAVRNDDRRRRGYLAPPGASKA